MKQSRPPDEIIVVDASDDKHHLDELIREFSGAPINWLASRVSVCVQRNAGIQTAKGDWILLCDDDIELDPDYINTLERYVEENADCGALAGRLCQLEGERWVDHYAVSGFSELVWRFVFQLSVWGPIGPISVPFFVNPAYVLMRRFYAARGNTLSMAGWPLITSWDSVFRTSIYSLGANLIKRQWLLKSPYDESLDPSGIGDNYGVALGFPGDRPIHVLGSTRAYHHRASENRLPKSITYYRRLLALHYFLVKQGRSVGMKLCFLWSLLGNTVMFVWKRERAMAASTIKAMWLIARGANPYCKTIKKDESNLMVRTGKRQ